MKRTSLILLGLIAVAGMAATSAHAQYFLRGDFNGWGTTALTDNGDGSFSTTVTGTPGSAFNFKIATADWSSGFPGSNARSVFDASGSFTVNWMPGASADGWNPSGDRVGYEDPGQFGWEVIGAFNGWSSPVLSLTSMGKGLYVGDYTIAAAGSYDFKFREAGSWDISIGADFGNSAGNANVTTTDANQTIEFQLDLAHGRWTTSVVPEPSTMALLVGGAMLLAVRRGRK